MSNLHPISGEAIIVAFGSLVSNVLVCKSLIPENDSFTSESLDSGIDTSIMREK